MPGAKHGARLPLGQTEPQREKEREKKGKDPTECPLSVPWFKAASPPAFHQHPLPPSSAHHVTEGISSNLPALLLPTRPSPGPSNTFSAGDVQTARKGTEIGPFLLFPSAIPCFQPGGQDKAKPNSLSRDLLSDKPNLFSFSDKKQHKTHKCLFLLKKILIIPSLFGWFLICFRKNRTQKKRWEFAGKLQMIP